MAITLGQIYRDLNSQLASQRESYETLFPKDVINAINEAIASLRIEYIQNGLGYEFATTESITPAAKDSNYTFAYSASLSYPLLRSLPIDWTVRQTLFLKAGNELLDSAQTWSAGDLAYKDGVVYKAISDISNTNTYDLTFEVDNVRDKNADLEFAEGDISHDGTTFYRYESSSWVQLYWRKVDSLYKEGRRVPFDQLHQLRLKDVWEHYPYAIREDKVYTLDTTNFEITYIPEWTYVSNLASTLGIPDSMVTPVKQQVLQMLTATRSDG